MSFANPDDASLRALLDRVRTIAVIGLSPQPARPSYRVAQAMQRYGYRIVPVRPLVEEVLGEKAYARLADIPFAVDLVDVFRATEHVPAIVEQCLAPRLRPGQVVVMDNLAAHKSPRVAELVGAAGARVVYLPPYSPDLNPIEQAISKTKAALRRLAARTVDDLFEAIGTALRTVTADDAANYVRHCGYATTR